MITETLSWPEAVFIAGPCVGLGIALLMLGLYIGDYNYRRRRGQNGPLRLECLKNAIEEAMRVLKMLFLIYIAYPSVTRPGDQADLRNPLVLGLYILNWLIVGSALINYFFSKRIIGMIEDLAYKRTLIQRVPGVW